MRSANPGLGAMCQNSEATSSIRKVQHFDLMLGLLGPAEISLLLVMQAGLDRPPVLVKA